MRTEQGAIGSAQPILRSLGLVPEGIDQRRRADTVETLRALRWSARARRRQILDQLLLRARARSPASRRRAGRAARPAPPAPPKRRAPPRWRPAPRRCRRAAPRRGSAARPSRRGGATRRVRLVAAVLAGQQPAGQRAPDQDADALVDGDRHQLVLGLARLERVVDLLADKALPAAARSLMPSAFISCQPA